MYAERLSGECQRLLNKNDIGTRRQFGSPMEAILKDANA